MPTRTLVLFGMLVFGSARMLAQLEVDAQKLTSGSLLWVGGEAGEWGEAKETDRTVVQLLDTGTQFSLFHWVKGPGRVTPIQRISTQEILLHVEGGEQPGFHLVNSEAGTSRFIAPGSAQEFVGSHQRSLILRQSRSRGEFEFHICAYDLDGEAKPRLLGSRPYRHFLSYAEGRLLLVTIDQDDSEFLMVPVSQDGAVVSFGKWAGQTTAWGLRGAFSPNGELAAFTIQPTEEHPKWQLLVQRVADGGLVRSFTIESVDVSPLSSVRPRLEFAWLDSQSVRWAETRAPAGKDQDVLNGRMWWVDAHVVSGKILAAREYRDRLELRHEVQTSIPDAEGKLLVGRFALAPGKLTMPGQEVPLIDSWQRPERRLYTPIQVSPCALFAAGVDSEPDVITLQLARADSAQASPIAKGRRPVFGWFPPH